MLSLQQNYSVMKNNLVQIFIGSDIEANYIASLLKENMIDCIVQNMLEESSSAGWAAGSSFNSSIIRISTNDIEKAKQLIDDYNSSSK